jgi:hypothetical protein
MKWPANVWLPKGMPGCSLRLRCGYRFAPVSLACITDETEDSQSETVNNMKGIYYFAAFTDSSCIIGCSHKHRTLVAATACISPAGGYVIAVENEELRALTDAEEAEFQKAMYGGFEAEHSDYTFRFPVRLRPQKS